MYINAFSKKISTSLIAMGCVLVFSHFGVIIMGSFYTISLIISKDALPFPTIIPDLSTVNANNLILILFYM